MHKRAEVTSRLRGAESVTGQCSKFKFDALVDSRGCQICCVKYLSVTSVTSEKKRHE